MACGLLPAGCRGYGCRDARAGLAHRRVVDPKSPHLLYAKSASGCSGACSSTMSCSMLRTRKPPAVTNAASISNPYEKLPVASLIRPINQGATNAPRAATELMKAMPTAADGPVRKFGASVQNTGDDAYTPIAESV